MSGYYNWTPERRAELKALVARGLTAREVAPTFGLTRKAVIDAVRKHDLGPWRAKPGSRPGDTNHIPADFAERWHNTSQAELAAHYKRATGTISLWVKRLGLVRTASSTTGINRPRPADFMAVQAGLTIQQIMLRYGVGRDVVRRWLADSGIDRQQLRLIKPNAYLTAPIDRVARDSSRAGQAADFLRRFGAVYRCNERGGADVKGNRWRRGSAILTDAELIERAERNGWDADAWKRVA